MSTYLDELQSLSNEDIIEEKDKNVKTIIITEETTRIPFEFNDTELVGTDTTFYRRSQQLYTKLQENTTDQLYLKRIEVDPEKECCDFKFNHIQPKFDLFPLIDNYLYSRRAEYPSVEEIEIVSNGDVKVSFSGSESRLPEEDFRGSRIYSGLDGEIYLTFKVLPTVKAIIQKVIENIIQTSPILSRETLVVTFLCYRERFNSGKEYAFEFEISSERNIPKMWLK